MGPPLAGGDIFQTPAPGSTILLVEDDLDIREAISSMLGDLGYEVATASDGREALGYLRSCPKMPRLILLDLVMPGMDGYAFRTEQRRDPRIAEIPVVVLTGDHSARLKSDALGEVHCLEKPPRFLELVDAIKTYV